MKKLLTKTILILTILSPLSVFAAQGDPGITDFSGLGDFINNIKKNVVVNLSALFLTTAVVAFFYGVINYIIAIRNGDSDGTKSGRNFMLWGLIALFVMFSVWGIVTFAQKTLGIAGVTTIEIPSIVFKTGNAPTAGTPSGLNPSDVSTGVGGTLVSGNASSFLNSLLGSNGCKTSELDTTTGNTRYFDAANGCKFVGSTAPDGTKYDANGNLLNGSDSTASQSSGGNVSGGAGSSCQSEVVNPDNGYTYYYDTANNCALIRFTSSNGTQYDSQGQIIQGTGSKQKGEFCMPGATGSGIKGSGCAAGLHCTPNPMNSDINGTTYLCQ